MNIANQGFPAFRADLNDALGALVSNSSGSTEPSTMFAHQFWVDTSTAPNVLKQRNADNDAWITIGSINQTNDTFNLAVAQGGTGAADAATALTNLGALASTNPSYTGTLTGGTGVINIGSGQLYKDASGRIGIGTTNPGRDFVINTGSRSIISLNQNNTEKLLLGISDSDNAFIIGDSNGDAGIRSAQDMFFSANDGGSAHMVLRNSGQLQTKLTGISNVMDIYGCRAWVNFNGTTSPGTIRASGNVSSVTRNGTGDYTVNFTTAMPDANYAMVLGTSRDDGAVTVPGNLLTLTSSSANFELFTGTGGLVNRQIITASIFR
jgi:hypothetical protein